MKIDNQRQWHENFNKYTGFIVRHPNYEGIFYEQKTNGQIKWVVTGKSEAGKKRREWWDKQCRKYGIKVEAGCYATIARVIHPTKKHVCQICGREMSVFYVYPSQRLLSRINLINKKCGIAEFKFADKDIYEIIDILLDRQNPPFEDIRTIFDIPHSLPDQKVAFISFINAQYVEKCSAFFSPGVMSNSPDRLDGFHSDGLCHRSLTDKGRHRDNLQRYSQDRRAYENWAEGDWSYTNRLMGEFKRFSQRLKCPNCAKVTKITADHIGPISLGFTHRPMFKPLCNSCNSQKNNRMSYCDVRILIEHEKQGQQVVSWHSRFVWNALKTKVKNDHQALQLSKTMRSHLHNILTLLSLINEKGYNEFLKTYLKPQYSFFDYKFKNFHPFNVDKLEVIRKPLKSENKRKNAERYIRISFESLKDYREKKNRKVKQWISEKVDKHLEILFDSLKRADTAAAHKQLNRIVFQLSNLAIKNFLP